MSKDHDPYKRHEACHFKVEAYFFFWLRSVVRWSKGRSDSNGPLALSAVYSRTGKASFCLVRKT